MREMMWSKSSAVESVIFIRMVISRYCFSSCITRFWWLLRYDSVGWRIGSVSVWSPVSIPIVRTFRCRNVGKFFVVLTLDICYFVCRIVAFKWFRERSISQRTTTFATFIIVRYLVPSWFSNTHTHAHTYRSWMPTRQPSCRLVSISGMCFLSTNGLGFCLNPTTAIRCVYLIVPRWIWC